MIYPAVIVVLVLLLAAATGLAAHYRERYRFWRFAHKPHIQATVQLQDVVKVEAERIVPTYILKSRMADVHRERARFLLRNELLEALAPYVEYTVENMPEGELHRFRCRTINPHPSCTTTNSSSTPTTTPGAPPMNATARS